jgi:muconolactone delta-isomerase
MQFLSISQRRNGFAESHYVSLAEQEMERARELYSQGFIRQIWHRLDMPGAPRLV